MNAKLMSAGNNITTPVCVDKSDQSNYATNEDIMSPVVFMGTNHVRQWNTQHMGNQYKYANLLSIEASALCCQIEMKKETRTVDDETSC